MVDVEHSNRGPAGRRLADKNGAEPFEVAIPALASRIVEPNNPSRKRISTAQVRPFSEIASVATPAAVLGSIDAAMLLGEDMLDVETDRRSDSIWDLAVLAPAAGPFADELTKGPRHYLSRGRFNRARALACSMAMKSMT